MASSPVLKIHANAFVPSSCRNHFKPRNIASKLQSRTKLMPVAAHAIRSEVSLSTGACLISHPRKAETGGEDAFFVSKHNRGVLAIADGVSGWAERNVNPALFSQELMRNISNLIEDKEANFDPLILLKKAHATTSSVGSATIIIATLGNDHALNIANVGDCGLRVIRDGKVIFSTIPQEHYFDCPYQLSSEIIGQTYRDAITFSIDLLDGDTIVMGSDGLFDNIYDCEIISTITSFKDAEKAAKALANLAHNHSKDVTFDSPYTVEARNRGFDVPVWKKFLGKKLIGGKLDDITVIVGKVARLQKD